MKATKHTGRLGLLAVGFGIGALAATTQGVASADSSFDWLSSIDSLAGGALPAPSSGLDLAISFDGYSLLHEGSAIADTGIAGNGNFDFAIAYGDGAVANAYGGTGDYALADGTNAFADAGGGTGANFDNAIDIGNNDLSSTGTPDGAYAGSGDLISSFYGGTGAHDTAIDIGNNTNDALEASNGNNGAFAGAGGLNETFGDGNNDTAIDFGNNSGLLQGARAIDGNGNYASESGSTSGESEGAFAGEGNGNTAVSDISYTSNGDDVFAANGSDNYASAVGPENTIATADYGNSNVSYILDPFGSTASEATSGGFGAGGNSDLAAVLFTDGTANATYADHLYDIVTAAGNEAGTAASTSDGFLAELLSLF